MVAESSLAASTASGGVVGVAVQHPVALWAPRIGGRIGNSKAMPELCAKGCWFHASATTGDSGQEGPCSGLGL